MLLLEEGLFMKRERIMIKELLLRREKAIVDKWIQSIIVTYPAKTSSFLRLQKDQFRNPLGHIISESAKRIFDEIIDEFDPERVKLALSDIIKVRAVQNFSPSQAVGFIFFLKQVIEAEIAYEIKNDETSEELKIIEHRIDRTALTAFDLYMEAKEKVFQLRMNEVKSRLIYSINENSVESIPLGKVNIKVDE